MRLLIIAVMSLMALQAAQGQFTPHFLKGEVTSVYVSGDQTLIYLSIKDSSFGFSGRGVSDGVQLLRIRGATIDTLVNWVAEFGGFAAWGYSPGGLHRVGDSIYFVMLNTSDVGTESIDVLKVVESPNSKFSLVRSWKTEIYYYPFPVMLCSDLSVVASAYGSQFQSVDSSGISNFTSSLISVVADAQSARALAADTSGNAYLISNCDPQSPLPINQSSSIAPRFGAGGAIEGWDADHGVYSLDEGASWFSTAVVPDVEPPGTNSKYRYMFHRTLDDYHVVVKTAWIAYANNENATVYMKHATESTWKRQHLVVKHPIFSVAGDSLQTLTLSFKGYNWIGAGSELVPLVWQYDPTASVHEEPVSASVVCDLHTAFQHIDQHRPWTLYSVLGEVLAAYPTPLSALPASTPGLRFLVQGSSVVRVW